MGTDKFIHDGSTPNLRGVSILQALMIHLTSLLLSKLELTQTFSYKDHKKQSHTSWRLKENEAIARYHGCLVSFLIRVKRNLPDIHG